MTISMVHGRMLRAAQRLPDGVADKRSVFLEGIPFPSAVAVGLDGLWLGAPPNLLFGPDRNKDDKADEQQRCIRRSGDESSSTIRGTACAFTTAIAKLSSLAARTALRRCAAGVTVADFSLAARAGCRVHVAAAPRPTHPDRPRPRRDAPLVER